MSECEYLRGSCPVGCERTEEVRRSCWLYWCARAEAAESEVVALKARVEGLVTWGEIARELALAMHAFLAGSSDLSDNAKMVWLAENDRFVAAWDAAKETP